MESGPEGEEEVKVEVSLLVWVLGGTFAISASGVLEESCCVRGGEGPKRIQV